MWRAAAALERVDPKSKEALALVLLKQVRRSPAPTYAFWALTRLGARVPFYGPLNTVVHPQVVESWLEALAGFVPGHPSEKSSWAFCLAQLARKSGQRALDIDDSHRKTVSNVLQPLGVPEKWKHMVEEIVEPEGEEQSEMFGESLPIGLRLVRTGE
jgi:hypothetical protein